MEMKDEDAPIEDYEHDAAYGTYDGITDWHEAEAVAPLAAPEALPRQTCQHGTDYQQDCSSRVAICEYRDRVADAEIEMIRNQQRPMGAMILSAGSSSSSPLSKLVSRVRPADFDDSAPSERPPVATSLLPPIPPLLPPPAPAPTNVVFVGTEPKFREKPQ